MTGWWITPLRLWERVGALPDARLEPFAKAYKDPTLLSLDAALTALVDGLCENGDAELAPVLESARGHLQDVLDYEDLSGFGAGLGHPLWAALNLPVFLHVAKRADAVVEAGGGRRLRIVHDPVNRLADAYQHTLDRGTRLETAPGVARDPNGDIQFIGVRKGTVLHFCDSQDSGGVQAADVLVSSLARMASLVAGSKPWTDGITSLAVNLLPPLMDDRPLLVGAMASERSLAALLGRMVVEGEKRGIMPGGVEGSRRTRRSST